MLFLVILLRPDCYDEKPLWYLQKIILRKTVPASLGNSFNSGSPSCLKRCFDLEVNLITGKGAFVRFPRFPVSAEDLILSDGLCNKKIFCRGHADLGKRGSIIFEYFVQLKCLNS